MIAAGETAGPGPKAPPAGTDPMLGAIDALSAGLEPRLVPGLAIRRDNPGRTPQQWSVVDADGRVILSFGLIDRTFFWTWDEGTSNHYAKSPALMTRVITGELIRFGHIR